MYIILCKSSPQKASVLSLLNLQVSNTPYRGVSDCVHRVYREEGLRAFFKSYRTTLFMNVPFIAMHFT